MRTATATIVSDGTSPTAAYLYVGVPPARGNAWSVKGTVTGAGGSEEILVVGLDTLGQADPDMLASLIVQQPDEGDVSYVDAEALGTLEIIGIQVPAGVAGTFTISLIPSAAS